MPEDKKNWKENHLTKKHNDSIERDWCPLCVTRAEGEGADAPTELGVSVGDTVKPKAVFGKVD